jgi:hypothetical protein
VTPLVEALRWGQGAAALVLETLQRALAAGNSQRDPLVGQALRCGLLQRLLGLLDWSHGAGLVQGEQAGGSGGRSWAAAGLPRGAAVSCAARESLLGVPSSMMNAPAALIPTAP